jgi:hypothetical protein
MTFILDENFPTPEEINLQPCATSDRFLHAVPSSVQINQICQDVYNTSLVILDITLVGPFLFTPRLIIGEVDGTLLDVEAPFALGHYKNPVLPINTNCQTWFGQLVFDVGSVVPNYLAASRIGLNLYMDGQVPQAFNVTFPNTSVLYSMFWDKALIPSPINMVYVNGNLSVTFEYLGELECVCDISCSVATGVSQEVSFCANEQQSVTFYQDPNSIDPYSILIHLRDQNENESNLSFQSVFNVVPKAPVVIQGKKPKRLEVNITKASANNVEVDSEVQYQTLRYEGSPDNFIIWKDWSDKNWTNFVDYNITPGQKYGYALRFKGRLGDESHRSNWTEVTV